MSNCLLLLCCCLLSLFIRSPLPISSQPSWLRVDNLVSENILENLDAVMRSADILGSDQRFPMAYLESAFCVHSNAQWFADFGFLSSGECGLARLARSLCVYHGSKHRFVQRARWTVLDSLAEEAEETPGDWLTHMRGLHSRTCSPFRPAA